MKRYQNTVRIFLKNIFNFRSNLQFNSISEVIVTFLLYDNS